MSCNKEGYKKGERISTIELLNTDSNSSTEGEFRVRETWDWDGKLLQSITYHNYLFDDDVEVFKYEKGRIVSSEYRINYLK